MFCGALSLVQGMHPVRHPYAGCAALVEVAGLAAVPALVLFPPAPLWAARLRQLHSAVAGSAWVWGWLLKMWLVLNPTETFNVVPVSLHTGRLSDREEDRARTVQWSLQSNLSSGQKTCGVKESSGEHWNSVFLCSEQNGAVSPTAWNVAYSF